jgi:hypothetical protein
MGLISILMKRSNPRLTENKQAQERETEFKLSISQFAALCSHPRCRGDKLVPQLDPNFPNYTHHDPPKPHSALQCLYKNENPH